MVDATNYLNNLKELMFRQGPDPVKYRFRQFTFSKQLERNELAKNFEQKAPSPLVTALNVTKIAPAVFFPLEKTAAALETFLNGGVFLLNCASNSVFGSREIIVLNTQEKLEPSRGSSIISSSEGAEDQLSGTGILFVRDSAAADDRTQLSSTTAAPFLDSNGLLVDVLKDDSTALPPAPSHTLRNFLIGSGIGAAALTTVYIAASYFDCLPDSLNIFGNSNAINRHWIVNPKDPDECVKVECDDSENCVDEEECAVSRWIVNPKDPDECVKVECDNSENCVDEEECAVSRWIVNPKDSDECVTVKCDNSENCVSEEVCADYRLVPSSDDPTLCVEVMCYNSQTCVDEEACGNYRWITDPDDPTRCVSEKCDNSENCVDEEGCK